MYELVDGKCAECAFHDAEENICPFYLHGAARGLYKCAYTKCGTKRDVARIWQPLPEV